MKSISFLSEKFQFLRVKCSIFLNRRVFVMYAENDKELLWYSQACPTEYSQSTDSTGRSIVSECRLGKWS